MQQAGCCLFSQSLHDSQGKEIKAVNLNATNITMVLVTGWQTEALGPDLALTLDLFFVGETCGLRLSLIFLKGCKAKQNIS